MLNSLAGEAIDKSLSMLRPYGRFIEIGMTDIYKNRKIGMRHAAQEHLHVRCRSARSDRDRGPTRSRHAARHHSAREARRSASASASGVSGRTHRPMRFATWRRLSISASSVVSMEDAEGLEVERALPPVVIDADASYLITGGLGGLGLAVADRLARRGARHWRWSAAAPPRRSAQAAVESPAAAGRRDDGLLCGYHRSRTSSRASSARCRAPWGRCRVSCMPPWCLTMRRSSG